MKNHGVEFYEINEGSGETASGDVWVRIRARMFLNRGEELRDLWGAAADGITFRLKDREVIPGLRYAIEGMRVGGRRKIFIPPHLAYGENGVPDMIPPNAVIQGQVELLEAGQVGEPVPVRQQQVKGRSLMIRDWREEASRLPRWELVLTNRDDLHHPSKSILLLEWSTRSDGKWGRRTAQHRTIELGLTPDEIENLIDTGIKLPDDHPAECLAIDAVHCHGGMSPTRSNAGSVICRSLSIVEHGRYRGRSYIREDSPLWSSTDWGRRVLERVTPHLTEAPWRQKIGSR